ncbi:MAG: Helix-turn-helix domain [Verrucomicrobiota bacterium]|jgi:predicted transcriptional regulator
MSDSIPNPPPNPPAAAPKLNPVDVFFALGSDVRWAIVQMLADGRKMSTGEVATALGRKLDGMGKQLKVMSDAGVLDFLRGEDRRQAVFQIPAAYRTTPGVLDFGFCVVDLKKA